MYDNFYFKLKPHTVHCVPVDVQTVPIPVHMQ